MKLLFKTTSWVMILLCIYVPTYAQMIHAQRTIGSAPLGIHLSVNSNNWDTLSQQDYEWHFPDGDTSIGYQVIHTFESSGWVKLKKTSMDNTISWDSVYIEVLPPSVSYPGSMTQCISASGSFDGCPAGAVQVTTGNLNSISFEANKRYLFNETDSFQLSVTKALAEGVYLGSFGAGTEKPTIVIQGNAAHTVFWMNDSITITDLHFYGHEWVSSAAWGAMQYGEGRLLAPENHTTIYKVDVSNMTSFAIMDDGIGARNNLVIDRVNAVNLGSYFVYAGPSPSMQYSGVKRSSIYNVVSNHGIRMNGGKWFTVAQSHFDSVDRSQITFRGLEYGLISDSKFTGKALYKNSVRNIWDDGSTADTVRNILFERNTYHTRGNEFGIDLNIGSAITIRNNQFINASLNVGENLAGVIPQSINIYHNTFYNTKYDWYATITLRQNGSGVFKGNIVYVEDCTTSDCLAQNPFAAHSSKNPSHWALDYNAYYKSGDAIGTSFNGSTSFSAWKALGWEHNSIYENITFTNPSTDIDLADFTPTLSAVMNQVPFMTHRDIRGKRRYSTVLSDIGAWEDVMIMDIKNPKQLSFSLYPNPATERLHLQYDGRIQVVIIYDNQGKVLQSLKGDIRIVDISALNAGHFNIEIIDTQAQRAIISFVKVQ